jgi:hypothetical protein
MARSYGKTPKYTKRASRPKKTDGDAFKIRLRGKDNAPLSMADVQQGLLEVIRRLRAHENLRAKWMTIYMTVVDEDGKEVLLDPSGEWEIYPYKCAADEHGA